MKAEIVIAGFGGQGILFAARTLAYAAMFEGFEVTYLPSYGPQMRGGTANCVVIIADRRIFSPISVRFACLVALNRPSLVEFAPRVRDDGVVIVNTSMATLADDDTRVATIGVPATRVAEDLGSARAANMVALGALVSATSIVTPASVEDAIHRMTPDAQNDMRVLNLSAFRAGAAFAAPLV